MSLDNAQILHREDGHWLEVTDPRGRSAALCLEQILRQFASHRVETTVLAWADAQARRTEAAGAPELWGDQTTVRFVQVRNSRSGKYGLIDRKTGNFIDHSDSPFEDIPLIQSKTKD